MNKYKKYVTYESLSFSKFQHHGSSESLQDWYKPWLQKKVADSLSVFSDKFLIALSSAYYLMDLSITHTYFCFCNTLACYFDHLSFLESQHGLFFYEAFALCTRTRQIMGMYFLLLLNEV